MISRYNNRCSVLGSKTNIKPFLFFSNCSREVFLKTHSILGATKKIWRRLYICVYIDGCIYVYIYIYIQGVQLKSGLLTNPEYITSDAICNGSAGYDIILLHVQELARLLH
jgi:hypothetical protein